MRVVFLQELLFFRTVELHEGPSIVVAPEECVAQNLAQQRFARPLCSWQLDAHPRLFIRIMVLVRVMNRFQTLLSISTCAATPWWGSSAS